MPLIRHEAGENNSCPLNESKICHLTGEVSTDGEEEKITLELKNVQVLNDNEKSLGLGNLYLTTEKVFWTPIENSNTSSTSTSTGSVAVTENEIFSFKIDYPSVLLHAICKDSSVCSKPCLYCQVSLDPKDPENDEPVDIKFVPTTEDELNRLFNVFSEMQMLWPDDDCISEEDDEMFGDMGGNGTMMMGEEGCGNPDIMAMLEQQMTNSMENLDLHGNEDLDTTADPDSPADSLVESPPGANTNTSTTNQTGNTNGALVAGWTLGKDDEAMADADEE